ncbi:hypothetical protein EG329_006931 [Mollisiaceae sp. DMI_Dod_QoI]|nr:hypothetical protein EG329_006931 [Helotiales sp. DMI_Dod_QoI]
MSQNSITPNVPDSPPPYEAKGRGANSQNTTENRYPKTIDITRSARGYKDGMRKHFEVDTENALSFSIWNIFKSTILQDFSALSTPVVFNEPLSQLQRHVQDFEYAELLNTAVDLKDSLKRMLYVAAFVCSKYASASQVYRRSFNPLLGETYEYVDPEKGYRFLAEQVNHHPPMLAVWADSPRWTCHGESAIRHTIRLQSIDVDYAGTYILALQLLDGTEEMYTWKKPVMSVKMPLVAGSPTIEQYGPINIKNWTTGEVCTVDGFKVAAGSEVHGKIVSRDGKPSGELVGHWNEKFCGTIFPPTDMQILRDLDKTDDANCKGLDSGCLFPIWESSRHQAKHDQYLTPFLIGLNDLPDTLRAFLPPTDSRLRPDQRALENGQHELADAEKKRVEEQQRKRQRRREEDGLIYTPRWFRRKNCEVTGEEYWEFDDRYWRVREGNDEGRWKDVEEIFRS